MLNLNQILSAIQSQIMITPTSEKRNHLCDAQLNIMAAMEPCAIEHLGRSVSVFSEELQRLILEAVDSNENMTLVQIKASIQSTELAKDMPPEYIDMHTNKAVHTLVAIGSLHYKLDDTDEIGAKYYLPIPKPPELDFGNLIGVGKN